MNRPDDPLAWPDHFPPKDRWKQFFAGVRGLGPDLSLFEEFHERQSLRNEASKVTDDLSADAAINAIESRVGRQFSDEFWQRANQLKLGEVVHEMLERGSAA